MPSFLLTVVGTSEDHKLETLLAFPGSVDLQDWHGAAVASVGVKAWGGGEGTMTMCCYN